MRRLVSIVLVLSLGVFAGALGAHEEQAPAADNTKVAIGHLSDFPAGTVRPFAKDQFIVFSDPEGIYAISTRCTHRSCTVSYKKEQKILACPCHGARFDAQGKVIRGPAAEDLAWYSVTKNEKGELIVDKDKPVPAGTKFVFP